MGMSLARRGPDCSQQLKRTTTEGHQAVQLHFFSSVLHLRGETMAPQPAVDEFENVLVWNGQVYDGLDIPKQESDTTHVLKTVARESPQTPESVQLALSTLVGPYAFIYYIAATQQLVFGRGPLGRRSLLVRKVTTLKLVAD
ncbi:unnamed protein product [Chrysoparadoxa australica]